MILDKYESRDRCLEKTGALPVLRAFLVPAPAVALRAGWTRSATGCRITHQTDAMRAFGTHLSISTGKANLADESSAYTAVCAALYTQPCVTTSVASLRLARP